MSLNAHLWRANPCSAIGRVVSQLDAPFSVAAPMALFRVGGSFAFASLASCCSLLVAVLLLPGVDMILTGSE